MGDTSKKDSWTNELLSPDRGRDNNANEAESRDNEKMRRRKLVNVLQEESVEFWHLPEDNQLTECHETHVSACRIEPSDGGPAGRCELQYSPLEFARSALNVPYADPLVLSDLQYRTYL